MERDRQTKEPTRARGRSLRPALALVSAGREDSQGGSFTCGTIFLKESMILELLASWK